MASSNRRPPPLFDFQARQRPLCPVCGSASYSAAGIHPQCSAVQWDRQRMQRLKSRGAAAVSETPKPPLLKAWHRVCPKCGAQTHLRKPQCACGHAFNEGGGS